MAATAKPRSTTPFFSTRRGRVLIENGTAYLFLFPAGLIIFLFGIFPVAFALFVSLHRWRRFPGEYEGLGNFTRALDNFGYVFFFWMALAALVYASILLYRLLQSSGGERRALLYVIPGAVNGAAVLLFVRWFFALLPVVLDIPQRIRGQERVQGVFMTELAASFGVPHVADAGNVLLVALAAGVGFSLLFARLLHTTADSSLLRASSAAALIGAGGLLLQLLLTEIAAATEVARAAGEELPLWSQIVLISAGAGLLLTAYGLWQRAHKHGSDRSSALTALAALALMVGGYLVVAELPRALANADTDMLQGFNITFMFVLGTVPFQLAIGLGLAYLLFQNIRGKTFFRLVYFLPYITPFVATSIVFKLLFSHRPTAFANQVMGVFGLPDQKWLLEPTGVFKLIFGDGLPNALAGPSLALVVIMIYTVWTYIGYDTVIFLAGLVNIPGELYEAARIDGGSGWTIFRYITLPLLSPTTFFLSLIAIIGTFQAFTQIYVMRTPAAAGTVDTLSVYIFEEVRATDPNMGYGSALAFVLFVVILLLTFFQNRIAERNVFYG